MLLTHAKFINNTGWRVAATEEWMNVLLRVVYISANVMSAKLGGKIDNRAKSVYTKRAPDICSANGSAGLMCHNETAECHEWEDGRSRIWFWECGGRQNFSKISCRSSGGRRVQYTRESHFKLLFPCCQMIRLDDPNESASSLSSVVSKVVKLVLNDWSPIKLDVHY